MGLRPAGDVNGDGIDDFLLTSDGAGLSYLVFGGNLTSDTAQNLFNQGQVIQLPGGAWRAIGDFNGDGKADLGRATMVQSQSLDEKTTLEHQVVDVFFSGDRTTLTQRFTSVWGGTMPSVAADLQLEPGRASYSVAGTTSPQSLLFASLGGFQGTDAGGNTRTTTRVGVAGPAGDSLRVYWGQDLFDPKPVVVDPASAPELPVQAFVFDLAKPLAPNAGPPSVPGIDVAAESDPALRDAFGIAGATAGQAAAECVSAADFSPRPRHDILVSGTVSLLLGPTARRGDPRRVCRTPADIIIDLWRRRGATSRWGTSAFGGCTFTRLQIRALVTALHAHVHRWADPGPDEPNCRGARRQAWIASPSAARIVSGS
jgi:hypothetical protein